MSLVARLSRTVPLLAVLAILAIAVYLVVACRRSPTRAKEVLILVFTVLFGAISAFFGIVSLYALSEGNEAVLDLGVCFMVVGLAGVGIVRWCNHEFLKHHPHYKDRRQKAKVIHRWPWGTWNAQNVRNVWNAWNEWRKRWR